MFVYGIKSHNKKLVSFETLSRQITQDKEDNKSDHRMYKQHKNM